MHDALGVRGAQRIGDLDSQVEQFIDVQRLSRDALPQRLAFQVLHGHERPAVGLADIVQRADIGMIQG